MRMVVEHEYDLVLMDMQMPVMDGLAATRAIRLKPEFQSLPIIAMTANVMESDRERCTEAGMNDHLTKPIDPDALFAALLRWIKPRADVAATAPPEFAAALARPRSPEQAGVGETASLQIEGLDTQSALRRTGGNPKRYEMLLRKFAESANVEEIREAHAAGDATTAARAAHSLKGAAANLGATAVANSAAGRGIGNQSAGQECAASAGYAGDGSFARLCWQSDRPCPMNKSQRAPAPRPPTRPSSWRPCES